MENTTLKIGKIERTYPEFKLDSAIINKYKKEIAEMEFHQELLDIFHDTVESFYEVLSLETLEYFEKTLGILNDMHKAGTIDMEYQNGVLNFLIAYALKETEDTIKEIKGEAC